MEHRLTCGLARKAASSAARMQTVSLSGGAVHALPASMLAAASATTRVLLPSCTRCDRLHALERQRYLVPHHFYTPPQLYLVTQK